MGHPATQLIGRRIGMVPGELTPFGFYANDVFINLIFFTFSKFCAMSDMRLVGHQSNSYKIRSSQLID